MADPITANPIYYDYTQKRFSDSHGNFLRYINDSARNLDEFVGLVGDHIESFMDIIETFKRIIDTQQSDEGKQSMRDRIKELRSTIAMLEFVLKDIKTNPLGKNQE